MQVTYDFVLKTILAQIIKSKYTNTAKVRQVSDNQIIKRITVSRFQFLTVLRLY